nr:MAG TPA: hypothetical protein [Caudoviricetes sp.]
MSNFFLALIGNVSIYIESHLYSFVSQYCLNI